MKVLLTLFLFIPLNLCAGYFDGIPKDVAQRLLKDAEKYYPESYSNQESYITRQVEHYYKMQELKKELNKLDNQK